VVQPPRRPPARGSAGPLWRVLAQKSLAAEFVEIATGTGADALDRRPQLAAALAKARKAKAPVVVAKLCRLSRDVALRHPFRKRHARRPANCAAILVNRRPRHPSIASPLVARVRTNQAAAPASRLQPWHKIHPAFANGARAATETMWSV